ncbi:MAG: hypothetical protein ACOY5B_16560 [Spirochaetota bacterium]
MFSRFAVIFALISGTARAEFFDMTARGEKADLNRISVHAQVVRSPIRIGLEYERTLFIWGWLKPAIGASANTGAQVTDDTVRGFRNSEYTSYIDAPVRLAIMPIEYFQVYAGGGMTFYSTTLRLKDIGSLPGLEGSATKAGAAPFVEAGFRISYGSYSVGMSASYAQAADITVRYNYLSGGNRVYDSFQHTPFMNARASVFAGFLF